MDKMSGNDEELQFYDAHEEIVSSSSTADSCSPYDVWNGSPRSVKDRRREFLTWMGVCEDRIPFENSDVANSLELDVNRVRECSSGAVLRSSGGIHREFSSSRLSFSWSSSISLDCCWEDENVNKCDGMGSDELLMGGQESTNASIASSPYWHYCREKENEKGSSFAGMAERVKKGWWGRLRSLACVVDKHGEEGQLRGPEYDDAILGSRSSRVKVKQHKKQLKELSALYKGQDIRAHEGSIVTMKFSHDGQYLASAGEDGIVRVWRIVEEERRREHETPETDPSCMYFEVNDVSDLKLKPLPVEEEKIGKSKSMRKTSDSACIILPPKVFQILEKPLHEFHGHGGEILDVSWSNNNYLLSASVDQTVRLWRVGDDNCLGVFPHNNYVTSIQFNPLDDNYFLSGSIDGKVRIWKVSSCQVVDWAEIRDIVSAVCYRPDGQGGLIGTLTGNCRFFNILENQLELDAQICLHGKKKSPNKRITGFQFFPQDPSKVMVVSADSQVRILHGINVVSKYKGLSSSGSHTAASFTPDGKHIVSTCEDSKVYVWNFTNQKQPSSSQVKKVRSCERFFADASVAIPWCGFSDYNSHRSLPLPSPSSFSLGEEHFWGSFPKGSATWPEEKLPAGPLSPSPMHMSQYKFFKASIESIASSHAWGLVIVTAGWDGRIRSYHNYGLPVPT